MEPLDEGQRRELEFLQSQSTAWVNLSPLSRLLWVIAVTACVGVAAGGCAALAGGPWLWFGLGGGLVALLLVGANAVAPQRWLELSVRATVPPRESMERGDRRSWPG